MDVVPLHPSEIRRAAIVFGDTPERIIRRLNQTSPKRLTDAELAAEVWRAEADWRNAYRSAPMPQIGNWAHNQFDAQDRIHTLHRFATHPHHDEEQA